MCVGVGIKRDIDNDCLLRSGGVFVWTVRTLTKLGGNKDNRMRFLLQMMRFFYELMGGDAIVESVPFQQFLGPLGKN